jgi:pimeloyl-ACP methyl ester carboxylesterase
MVSNGMTRSQEKLDPREACFYIPGPVDGLKLFLRHLEAAPDSDRLGRDVLYIHGMSFPSALSIAHRIDGRSWRDELCDSGFDVWALDFYGFGPSDRYVEMAEPAELNPPLGGVHLASHQIERAIRFICEHQRRTSLSIIGHSGGCTAIGIFAARCPELLDRIVFFAPIVQRVGQSAAPKRFPAWRVVSLKDQWDRFTEDVPHGERPVLSQSHFQEWGERYLETDSQSRTCSPAGVKIPCGLIQDVFDVLHGAKAYDPSEIRAPVAIIRGEWDTWSSEDDVQSLFNSLKRAPIRRFTTISRGTHLLHLEESRYALYRESITFLQGRDTAPEANNLFHYRGSNMNALEEKTSIPGYTYGTDQVAKSPISMDEWEELKKTALFSEEDVVYLRMSEDLLKDHVDDLLNAWRGIVFDLPHLSAYYQDPTTHQVDTEYAKAVRKRFGQWILDTARAKYDQAWLDYQYEIGLRHHRSKKNKTDNGHTVGHIRGRDLIAFVPSIVIPMKPYLASNCHPAEVVERMYMAWWKSMTLQATLWCQPYFREGDF